MRRRLLDLTDVSLVARHPPSVWRYINNDPTVEKAFVLGVRALEFSLGIICDDTFASGILTDSIALPAFRAALPIIAKLSVKYGISPLNSFDWSSLTSGGFPSLGQLAHFLGGGRQRKCLSTQ